MDPLKRLAIAMSAAAHNIGNGQFRAIAARAAQEIPKTVREIGGGKRGEMARMGRAKMLALADLPQEELADAAELLRGCSNAILSDFRVTSEVSLGDRRRRRA